MGSFIILLEGIPVMSHEPLPARIGDGNDIEPADCFRETSLRDISLGRAAKEFLFRGGDGFLGRSESFGSAHFHLDENDLVSIPRHDVDFPVVVDVIPVKHNESLPFQKGYSKSLSFVPDSPVRRHPPSSYNHLRSLNTI